MALPRGDVEPYYDLGSYHRAVDTTSAQAQRWFDRGMVWAYAFNHEEAVRCFEQALGTDPDLAIARWGIAYSVGPNYNKAWDAFDPVELAASLTRARDELRLATGGRATAVERGLIDALSARFPPDDVTDTAALADGNASYAAAMTDLATAYPNDMDVAALTADALVNLTAWTLWDTHTGEPAPGSRVVEAKQILQTALTTPGGRAHPGILHLYLHTMELSAHPEQALPAADLLRGMVPDAGHLEHMPTHIDVLCGDYRNAVVSNQIAVRADRRFLEREGALNFTRPTGHTTCTSSCTPRCSPVNSASRWRPPMNSPSNSLQNCCPSNHHRWPTGWRPSFRFGCTSSSASVGGKT